MSRRGWGVGLTLAVAGAAALAKGRVRRYEVAEDSMRPALFPGDYVLAVRTDSIPIRGDVVIVTPTGDAGLELVKRVIGLPGETVEISGGQVHIDGAPLAEPWADGPSLPDGSWTLGTDEVFLLGDQRALSIGDSRMSGPFGADQVRWRVATRYWPVGRVGTVT